MSKEHKVSRSTFIRQTLLGSSAALAGGSLLSGFAGQDTSQEIKLATFTIDATPPVGCRCLAYETAERVDESLNCRGTILLTDDLPIVLVAIDWIVICNGGYDLWRMKLAQAAGTSPDRVAIHTLHQHNAPKFDTSVEAILLSQGLHTEGWATLFTFKTVERAAAALRRAVKDPVSVTHIGGGRADVKKFASNRRILGTDGTVMHVRFSSTEGRPELRKYPEGLIDPNVRLISFWNKEKPLAVLSYYATHPQSYYREESGISCDTVGIARNKREEESGIFHLHFGGAGGNIGAGKYNDGSHKNRQILARRLATGMKEAFDTTTRTPITQDQIEWRINHALLPPEIRREGKTLTEAELTENYNKDPDKRKRMARDLNWMHRCNMRYKITLSCLRLGELAVMHMPGELFVEYQLAAQAMREDLFVAMASHGDGGPGYIGTRAAYGRGGYETGYVSRVSPDVEEVLTKAMRELLQATNRDVTPSYFTQQKKRFKEIG